MNKFFGTLLIILFVACNNSNEGTTERDTGVTNVSGIENVNGNIADTTNSISVDGSSQSGTGHSDTLKKQ
ncbi:MAG TPA: hypothetical protein VM888_07325 [Chitinophagaceae bacterium]|nr:hypothetical protein [Chitinophagaceae bacterium]